MATTMQESMFSDVIQNCRTLINDPEIFQHQNPDIHGNFKRVSKNFYDRIVPCVISNSKSKSLKSLLINGFDDEQVWQQLEIQNKNAVQYLDSWFSQIASDDTLIDIDNKESTVNQVDNSHVAQVDKSSSDEEMEQDADSDDEYDSTEETKKDKNTSAGINMDEEDSEFDEIKDKGKKKDRSVKYKSKVDDQFFKLSKLEEFLRLEDLKEEKARDNELDESDDEEEDIDLFQDISDDDLDDSEDESNKRSSKNYMYDDFFDGPESGDENIKHPDGTSDVENEELDSEDANIPLEEDDSEGDDDEEESPSENKSKTPFQIEQENIKKQILEYEDSMVTPKPWQLTGEVDVNKRPVDGLLDLPTDFELNAKPIIIQDKEFCDKVENMIKMTIKNKAYSDGVRQDKPVKEVISMKKEIVIDQSKSKKGLAQEYEELYLKKQSKQEEEENPKHQEIRKFMDSLFPQLYALFSHIPKPAVPDIKIVSNLPAVTVEEVAPTSYSDGALLAPEEIKKRTGLAKSQTERTETDKNRERRKKKLHQKMKQKKSEKENPEGKPLSSKATKQEKLQVLKKLKQHKNTKIASVGGAKIKSSKDFFERLQETVSSKVNKGEAKQNKKKKKKA
ncbi:U3 small nucleolar ribonucleoprotein MPP10 [Araneus ventricosus]|uniref:U3 small nucleolar ribonucleoprotein protein MPP10 n=2 Tax=Araneus ventricosus TaxID=182803 RepID=A0A4Y2RM98_ARAVE|nr:U3 small nucleolar ribonucleoprotein MPP10 [Araneus ventricosus]